VSRVRIFLGSLVLVHRSAWKGNSQKIGYNFLHLLGLVSPIELRERRIVPNRYLQFALRVVMLDKDAVRCMAEGVHFGRIT
jgi:hypothetical protein